MARPRRSTSGSVCRRGKNWYFRFYEYSSKSPNAPCIRRSIKLGTTDEFPTIEQARAATKYFIDTKPYTVSLLLPTRYLKRDRTKVDMVWFADKHRDQSGRCAICGKQPKQLVVDHDHEDRTLRGLLCATCNSGLGMFRDSAVNLLAAVAYLEEYGTSLKVSEPEPPVLTDELPPPGTSKN